MEPWERAAKEIISVSIKPELFEGIIKLACLTYAAQMEKEKAAWEAAANALQKLVSRHPRLSEEKFLPITLRAKEAKRTCRHCQHWTLALQKLSGVCQKITQHGASSDNKAVVQSSVGEGVYFLTAPTFGCTLFEPVKERKRK